MISSGPFLYNKESLLGQVIKYWIDPGHLLTETDTIKNVITMEMCLDCFFEEFAMKQNDWDLTNLEMLRISYRRSYATAIPKLKLPFRFKNLKKLEINYVGIRINELLDILRFLGNTKNVKISANLKVISGTDKEENKKIFNQALEVVKEKFPFPDVRILDLNIYEGSWRNSIHYGKSGATLTTTDSDSENDTYFSVDGSVESSHT